MILIFVLNADQQITFLLRFFYYYVSGNSEASSSSSPSRTIVSKHDLDRDGAVSSVYQGRIQENINATRAEITMFALLRSESGEYEIILTNRNFDITSDSVTVQVHCK